MSTTQDRSSQAPMEVSPQNNQLSAGFVKCRDCGSKFVNRKPGCKSNRNRVEYCLERHLKSGACQRRMAIVPKPKILACEHCGRQYEGENRSSSLKKHLKQGTCRKDQAEQAQGHQNGEDKSPDKDELLKIACPKCSRPFVGPGAGRSLKLHLTRGTCQRLHVTPPTPDTPPITCKICRRTFQGKPGDARNNLKRHLARKVCERAKLAKKVVPEPVSGRNLNQRGQLSKKIVRSKPCNTVKRGGESYKRPIQTGLCRQRQLQTKKSPEKSLPPGPSGIDDPLSQRKTPRKSQTPPAIPKVSCEICGTSFSGPRGLAMYSLRRHLARNICEKVLQAGKSSGPLTPARRADTPSELTPKVSGQECELCGTRFPKKYTLLRHYKRTHAVAKIYNCPHCKNFYPTEPSLGYHRLISHERNVKALQPVILEEEDISSSDSPSESSSDEEDSERMREELRGEEEDAVWEDSGPYSPIRVPSPGVLPEVVVMSHVETLLSQKSDAQAIHEENIRKWGNFFLKMNRYK